MIDHRTPSTIDRSDPRFVQLCQSLQDVWRNIGGAIDAPTNDLRVEACIKHGRLIHWGRDPDSALYVNELTSNFSHSTVVRVLSKHVRLS